MTVELKILKGVLLLRKFNRYQTKEEQIAETLSAYLDGDITEERIDEWIDSLKSDIENPEEPEEPIEDGWSDYHQRDEWDDFWADRARDCGAVSF